MWRALFVPVVLAALVPALGAAPQHGTVVRSVRMIMRGCKIASLDGQPAGAPAADRILADILNASGDVLLRVTTEGPRCTKATNGFIGFSGIDHAHRR
ncbi:MAG TPA: hypothetical protein VNU97_10240 [Rhizomicrobium sp.]|jgi:hypothetical protein|nr:hypothetical protein [Rhizomicrobium sp.]